MPEFKVSKEDYDFLKSLAVEIRRQDNRCTAHPYFFVVQGVSQIPAPIGVGEPMYMEKDGDGESVYSSKEEFFEERACQGLFYEEIKEEWEGNIQEYGSYEVMSEHNVFLTERAFREHIRLNGHNYKHYKKVQSFVKHAFRNPEIERLVKILLSFADQI